MSKRKPKVHRKHDEVEEADVGTTTSHDLARANPARHRSRINKQLERIDLERFLVDVFRTDGTSVSGAWRGEEDLALDVDGVDTEIPYMDIVRVARGEQQ